MIEYSYPPFTADESRGALRSIVLQILDREIPSTIVADDTSARIPSLVVRQALQCKSAASGEAPPSHYFLNGNAADTAPIDDFCFPSSGNFLIVTDFVYSGRTILKIMRTLHRAGVPYENQLVAPIATEPHGITNLERAAHSVRLISGMVGGECGEMFQNSGRYSGVDNNAGPLHSHRHPDFKTTAMLVRRTRDEVKTLGKEIFDDWLQDQSKLKI